MPGTGTSERLSDNSEHSIVGGTQLVNGHEPLIIFSRKKYAPALLLRAEQRTAGLQF
jgi:hypothetical protein